MGQSVSHSCADEFVEDSIPNLFELPDDDNNNNNNNNTEDLATTMENKFFGPDNNTTVEVKEKPAPVLYLTVDVYFNANVLINSRHTRSKTGFLIVKNMSIAS